MKKLSILLLAFVALIGFNACTSDDDVVFIAQPDPEGIAFTNTFSSEYILTNATAENTAERFVWNEINLDVPTNINYDVVGSTSAEMTDFVLLGSTSGTNVAVKVKALLSLAEDAGLDNDPDTEAPNSGTLYVQVRATAGTGGEMLHESAVKAITVVLPEITGEEEVDLVELYMVGDASAAGWNPNNNNTPLFRDPENPNLYYYTGKLNAGSLKFVESTGWAPMYGVAADGTTLVYRPTEADTDPASITISETGYYSIVVNLDDLTVSVDPYDASSATTYTTIGIIGPAQPGEWATDTNMTPSTFNPHIWYVNDMELMDGEFKFRAGDDWADNWGTASDALSGKANYGSSDNMVAVAGVYDIWFNDVTGRYILIPQATE